MSKKAIAAAVLALAAAFAPAPEARAANAEANAILRLLNSRAAGDPKSYAAAAAIVAEDAKAGKPLQQFVLAVVSRERNAPPAARLDAATRRKYFDNSRERIRALAESHSNALAWYLLALENNDMRMLKRAAEGENVQALNAWGTMTLMQVLQSPGVDTNDMETVLYQSYSAFRKAADKKDANGLYNVGMCLMRGYGCKIDPPRAFENFRAAAEMGHAEAINNIGGFFRDGIVVERDPVKAARWFAKSADRGNAYGLLNYALALQRGDGVAQDVERAVKMLKASAEQGNEEAMNAYAMCLYNGDGVAQNRQLAVRWYRASAAHGFAPAMENLAACCDAGTGGMKKSPGEALVWRMRARAARGDRNAAAWLVQSGHGMK